MHLYASLLASLKQGAVVSQLNCEPNTVDNQFYDLRSDMRQVSIPRSCIRLFELALLLAVSVGCGGYFTQPQSPIQSTSVHASTTSNEGQQSQLHEPTLAHNRQFVKVGKQIQLGASLEAGQKGAREIIVISAIAVPLPFDTDVAHIIITPLSLSVNDSKIGVGKTLPVFSVKIVPPAYLDSSDLRGLITHIEGIELAVNQENVVSLGTKIHSTSQTQAVLLVTVDELAIQQFSQYAIDIQLSPHSQDTFWLRVLSVPTYEYKWVSITGTLNIKFQ